MRVCVFPFSPLTSYLSRGKELVEKESRNTVLLLAKPEKCLELHG